MKIHLYVGCALTHAPVDYKLHIEEFKAQLRKIKWLNVLDFITSNSTSTQPDPLRIYVNDIHDCVKTAHVVIGDVTYASLGLGWELGTSVEHLAIRTIMCVRRDAILSNLPKGAPLYHRNKHVTLIDYESSILERLPFCINELEVLRSNLMLPKKINHTHY